MLVYISYRQRQASVHFSNSIITPFDRSIFVKPHFLLIFTFIYLEETYSSFLISIAIFIDTLFVSIASAKI